MSEFRLTRISDTHLVRRLSKLTANFHRVSECIDARRPDLVVHSSDLAFDGPTNRDDPAFASKLHAVGHGLETLAAAVIGSTPKRISAKHSRCVRGHGVYSAGRTLILANRLGITK